MNESTLAPAVSIILPTYNRATFLAAALASIQAQTWSDWELIIVDDGSTDDTAEVLSQHLRNFDRPARIIHQANQGAYGARNTGLDSARGKYIAFFDSDDLWLPDHLFNCVDALEKHPEVDWVFSACRRIDATTGRELLANTFYEASGRSWPFLNLQTINDGPLHILNDPSTLTCMISGGLNCGLQASVIRRQLFADYRFQTDYRNEAEDQMAVIWALASHKTLAFFDQVHVVYQVHSSNSSAATPVSADRNLAVLNAEARGYAELMQRGIVLAPAEQKALRKRLLDQHFWQIGYTLLWQNGRRAEALPEFRRGLRYWPWNLKCWKTLLVAFLSPAFHRNRLSPSQ